MTARRWPATAAAVLAIVASVNLGAADSDVSVPGTDDLVNFEHVYNFRFPGAPPNGQGTDVEFYTATVPLRNSTTGQKLLDPGGNEILSDRDFAVIGAYGAGAYIFDVTDPDQTQFVRQVECNQVQNNPELKRFGSRWILGLTDDVSRTCIGPRHSLGSGDGAVALFDVTDPYEWKALYSINVAGRGHTFTWHPTKPYAWISSGDIPGNPRFNHLPIIDFSDLETADPTDLPTLAKDIPSVGSPHDLSFNADGSRAYVSEQHNFRIYDSTDPANPVAISAVGVSPGTYAHTSEPTPDGAVMVGTEESLALGGFFQPQTGVCPGEGLVFYGIAGPQEIAPVPLGYYHADMVGTTPDQRACTAHQFKIAPNSHVLVVGWYIGGVRVVDFSTPAAPVEIGRAQMADGEAWAAKFFKGPYVYTGDQTRGFDVFRWTGPLIDGKAPWEAG